MLLCYFGFPVFSNGSGKQQCNETNMKQPQNYLHTAEKWVWSESKPDASVHQHNRPCIHLTLANVVRSCLLVNEGTENHGIPQCHYHFNIQCIYMDQGIPVRNNILFMIILRILCEHAEKPGCSCPCLHDVYQYASFVRHFSNLTLLIHSRHFSECSQMYGNERICSTKRKCIILAGE